MSYAAIRDMLHTQGHFRTWGNARGMPNRSAVKRLFTRSAMYLPPPNLNNHVAMGSRADSPSCMPRADRQSQPDLQS
jgi:hypothetical protein